MTENNKDGAPEAKPKTTEEILAEALQTALGEIGKHQTNSLKAIQTAEKKAIDSATSSKDEIIKETKRLRRLLGKIVALSYCAIFLFPFALYWGIIHWSTKYDDVWARVTIFCVPQLVLGVLCVVALVARLRENEE
jgi:hypothetical protein